MALEEACHVHAVLLSPMVSQRDSIGNFEEAETPKAGTATRP